MHKRRFSRFIILVVLLIVITAGASVARGQEQEPPPRDQERTAPDREPVMLEREEVGPGRVNVLIELPPAADALIASKYPTTSFPDAALYVGYDLDFDPDQYGAQRPLLRFDVAPQIPDTALIESATLRLRVSYATPDGDPAMPTKVYNLLSVWQEDQVTWNTQPERGVLYAETPVDGAEQWYEWDITDLVRAWESGELANYGVELVGDETIQDRERAFYSRETATAYYPRLRITYMEDTVPPEVTVDPLPTYSPSTFTVSWSGDDYGGVGIAYYDIQYRVDGGEWIEWLNQVEDTSAEFTGEDGRTYQFRARGVDNAGNVEPFGDAEATTTVDASPPQTTVQPLPSVTRNRTFTVNWDSTGEGANIAYYDVRYRFNNSAWTAWQQQTLATSATFTAQLDGLYEFEARAVDVLGNVEPLIGIAESSIIVDAEDPFVTPRLFLPVVIETAS